MNFLTLEKSYLRKILQCQYVTHECSYSVIVPKMQEKPGLLPILTPQDLNAPEQGRREGGTCAKKHQVQQTEDDLPFYIHDCSKLWLGVSLEPHVWFSNDYMFWKEEGKPDKWRKALIFKPGFLISPVRALSTTTLLYYYSTTTLLLYY